MISSQYIPLDFKSSEEELTSQLLRVEKHLEAQTAELYTQLHKKANISIQKEILLFEEALAKQENFWKNQTLRVVRSRIADVISEYPLFKGQFLEIYELIAKNNLLN